MHHLNSIAKALHGRVLYHRCLLGVHLKRIALGLFKKYDDCLEKVVIWFYVRDILHGLTHLRRQPCRCLLVE